MIMSKLRRTTQIFVSLIVGVAMVAIAPSRVEASESGTDVPTVGLSVDANGWIQYVPLTASLGIPGTLQQVAGTKDELGECNFAGSYGSNANGADPSLVTSTEEVALNPATCDMQLLTTELTTDQAALLAPPDPADTTSSNAPSSAGTPALIEPFSASTAATAPVWNHYVQTGWIDPINITITRQTVALQWANSGWRKWAYNRYGFGGCVAGICLDKTYITSGSNSMTSLGNGWRKNATVNLQNDSFSLWVVHFLGPSGWAACGFPLSPTAKFHHEDHVAGYNGGAWAVSWNDSKGGACTNLVKHRNVDGASYPL